MADGASHKGLVDEFDSLPRYMAKMFGRLNRPKRCRYRCCLEWELRYRKRKRGYKESENKQWRRDLE